MKYRLFEIKYFWFEWKSELKQLPKTAALVRSYNTDNFHKEQAIKEALSSKQQEASREDVRFNRSKVIESLALLLV